MIVSFRLIVTKFPKNTPGKSLVEVFPTLISISSCNFHENSAPSGYVFFFVFLQTI